LKGLKRFKGLKKLREVERSVERLKGLKELKVILQPLQQAEGRLQPLQLYNLSQPPYTSLNLI
jgi:hypothetical protein